MEEKREVVHDDTFLDEFLFSDLVQVGGMEVYIGLFAAADVL